MKREVREESQKIVKIEEEEEKEEEKEEEGEEDEEEEEDDEDDKKEEKKTSNKNYSQISVIQQNNIKKEGSQISKKKENPKIQNEQSIKPPIINNKIDDKYTEKDIIEMAGFKIEKSDKDKKSGNIVLTDDCEGQNHYEVYNNQLVVQYI